MTRGEIHNNGKSSDNNPLECLESCDYDIYVITKVTKINESKNQCKGRLGWTVMYFGLALVIIFAWVMIYWIKAHINMYYDEKSRWGFGYHAGIIWRALIWVGHQTSIIWYIMIWAVYYAGTIWCVMIMGWVPHWYVMMLMK